MTEIVKCIIRAVLSVLIVVFIAAFIFIFPSVIHAITARGSDYDQAISKATQAALIQSGVQSYVDKAQLYGVTRAKTLACSVLPPSAVDLAAFLGMSAYKQRVLTPALESPLFPHTRHIITIEPTQASLQTVIEF